MRAVLYARVSLERNGEESSTNRQTDICRAYAESHGWTVVAEHADVGISGWSGADRPGWLAVEQLVKDRAVDAVVVFAVSRAARNTIRLLTFKELCDQQGVELHSYSEPISGRMGGMFLTILGALAELESQTKSERLLAQRLEAAQQGRQHGGGPRPYGWTNSMKTKLNEPEAAVIREVVALALQGSSLYAMTTMLNHRGVVTSQGKRWSPQNLQKLLVRPSLAGLREHGPSGTVVRGTWPSIISEDEHERVKALLRQSGNGAQLFRRGNRRGLLSGMLRCTECATRLIFTNKKSYRDQALTGGCTKTSAPARAIELEVLRLAERVAEAQKLARTSAPMRTDNTSAVVSELRNLDGRLQEFTDMLAHGELNRASYASAVQTVASRRGELDAMLRDAGEPTDEHRERLHEAIVQWQANALDVGDIGVLQDDLMAILGTDTVWLTPGVKYTRVFDPSRLHLRRPSA